MRNGKIFLKKFLENGLLSKREARVISYILTLDKTIITDLIDEMISKIESIAEEMGIADSIEDILDKESIKGDIEIKDDIATIYLEFSYSESI